MAIKLNLPTPPKWTFKTDASGEWDVYPYSLNAMKKVDEFIASDSADPVEGVRSLMAAVCKKQIADGEEDSKEETTPDDMTAFSDEDIQNFARQFLEHNRSLVEDSDTDLVKGQDQTDAAFLLEVLEAEDKKQSDRMREIFSRMKTSLGRLLGSSNSAIGIASESLLKQNKGLEKLFGARPNPLAVPHIPLESLHIIRNPTHDT